MKVLHLFLVMTISAGFAAFILYVPVIALLQGRVSTNYISEPDRSALTSLQNHFQKCVKHNGFGLQAVVKDICRVTMKFPSNTVPKWRNPKTGKMEGLSYDFNICETLSLWEQVWNSSTILTKEYIDFLPNGWHDYAWTKINKGIMLNNCENKTLCMEKLSLVLPETPPFTNHQYGRCAIVGNSGDLLKTNFGKEIDQYDAVIRNNGAPTQNYTEHSGKKCTFRLLNRGSAKALDKVAKLDEGEEAVLIVKTTIHDSMNKMIQEVPIRNPVYLMLGMSLGPAAKGTGLKAIEFALSLCQTVDIYGFTVDPGYTEWTRYFSESRGGHTPLQGRAYYQMMECLGLISIHSPMRDAHAHIVKHVPEKSVTESARIAYERTQRKQGSSEGECSIWATRGGESKKWSSHLKALREHYYGITRYPLHHSNTREMLCIRPNDFQ